MELYCSSTLYSRQVKQIISLACLDFQTYEKFGNLETYNADVNSQVLFREKTY